MWAHRFNDSNVIKQSGFDVNKFIYLIMRRSFFYYSIYKFNCIFYIPKLKIIIF